MKKLSAKTLVLAETDGGPILEMRISGNVESQRGGIASLVETNLSESSAAGIVFNLSELGYASWDDIGMNGIIAATKRFTRPCCVLSMGRNRENLSQLMEVTKLGELLGGQVFADSDAAVEYIRKSLEKRSV